MLHEKDFDGKPVAPFHAVLENRGSLVAKAAMSMTSKALLHPMVSATNESTAAGIWAKKSGKLLFSGQLLAAVPPEPIKWTACASAASTVQRVVRVARDSGHGMRGAFTGLRPGPEAAADLWVCGCALSLANSFARLPCCVRACVCARALMFACVCVCVSVRA